MAEQQRPSSLSQQLASNDSGISSTDTILMDVRHRGPVRSSSTSTEDVPHVHKQRRDSTRSVTPSETRNPSRPSTNLFLSRASIRGIDDGSIADFASDESHWNSVPLVLALLPALAEFFFRDGSAFITDVTLLILAATFLNWSVRLPWNWYRSAQAIRHQQSSKYYETIDGAQSHEESEENIDEHASEDSSTHVSSEHKDQQREKSSAASAASLELHIHELVALASCFIFPVAGTWLLHTIRSTLSRPSEGLVSNYNLTIFLLASEVRPCSHLLRMIQSRTLFLQRVVASSSPSYEEDGINSTKIRDLTKRLEELEAYIAKTAPTRLSLLSDSASQNECHQPSSSSSQQDQHDFLPALTSQVTAEIRRALQPEIDALNRAVRRYEKRTAITNYQIESRFQNLESQLRDAVAVTPLPISERPDVSHGNDLLFKIFAWTYAVFTFFVRTAMSLAYLPVRVALSVLRPFKAILLSDQRNSHNIARVELSPDQKSWVMRRPQKGKEKKLV